MHYCTLHEIVLDEQINFWKLNSTSTEDTAEVKKDVEYINNMISTDQRTWNLFQLKFYEHSFRIFGRTCKFNRTAEVDVKEFVRSFCFTCKEKVNPLPFTSTIVCEGDLTVYNYSECKGRRCAFSIPFIHLLKDFLVKQRISKSQFLAVVENYDGFKEDKITTGELRHFLQTYENV